jgi:hypothetical protein
MSNLNTAPAGPDNPVMQAMAQMSTGAFASARKLIELNLSAASEFGDGLMVLTRELLQAKEPTDLLVAQASAAQMLVAVGANYGSQLVTLAGAGLPEFVKVFEAGMAETLPKIAIAAWTPRGRGKA